MRRPSLGKGASYLYVETITSLIAGYVFWVVISRLTSPEIVGVSSTVISIATILASVITLGIPTGIQLFLGRAFAENKITDSKVIAKASSLLITIGLVGCGLFMLGISKWLYETYAIDQLTLFVTIVLIASLAFSSLLRSIVIASLDTKWLPISTAIGATGRFAVSIVLIWLASDPLHVIAGYAMLPIVLSVLLALSLSRFLRTTESSPHDDIRRVMKKIIHASSASWIPSLISIVGAQLGTIVVFGTHGAEKAGIYFVVFSLYSAVFSIATILLIVSYPALSAMDDGRKRFSWRVIKMSLLIAGPLSISAIWYAEDLLTIFGESYSQGSLALQILLVSIFPYIVASGINNLAYSYKHYKQVLVIGIALNLPRTLLYFILVPYLGEVGASLSFTIGSLFGLIVSLMIAKKIDFGLLWKPIVIVLAVPAGIGFAFHQFDIFFPVGMACTIVISFLILVRIRQISRQEIESSLDVLPAQISHPALKVIERIFTSLEKR